MSDGKKYSVYCITNTVNGKKYIGKSRSPILRLRTHINALRREADGTANFRRQHKQDFIEDFAKYGISAFSFSIIEENIETQAEALEKEALAIAEQRTYEEGYNTRKEFALRQAAAFISKEEIKVFEKDVKKRLIDLDWTIERLADEVSNKTGMFCDTSYIFKIWRGERNAPKIVSAVKEILGLEESV